MEEQIKNLRIRVESLERQAGFGGAVKFNPGIPKAEKICADAMGGSLPSRWAEGINKTFKVKGLEWFEQHMKPGIPEKAFEAAQGWDKFNGSWPVAWGIVVWYIEQQEYSGSRPRTAKQDTGGYPAGVVEAARRIQGQADKREEDITQLKTST